MPEAMPGPAADAISIYWTADSNGVGEVMMLDRSGGAPVVISKQAGLGIVMDALSGEEWDSVDRSIDGAGTVSVPPGRSRLHRRHLPRAPRLSRRTREGSCGR